MVARKTVLLVADERQFPPAAFLAARLSALNPDPAEIEIALASNAPVDLGKARAMGLPCRLIDASHLLADEKLPHMGYLTRATYYALFAPTVVGGRSERILYLDIDIYPASAKLFRLFDLDMQRFAVGAVRDLQVPFRPNASNAAELVETLKVPPGNLLGAKYLNSGVLLIDVAAYRRERIEKQALRLYRDGKPKRYIDQTTLNMILKGNWLEISPAFNMVMRQYLEQPRRAFTPEIMHFTGPLKPWHSVCTEASAVHAEMREFLAKSPWPAYLQQVNTALYKDGAFERPAEPPSSGAPLEALIRHLATTRFADVEQGLTPKPTIEAPATS